MLQLVKLGLEVIGYVCLFLSLRNDIVPNIRYLQIDVEDELHQKTISDERRATLQALLRKLSNWHTRILIGLKFCFCSYRESVKFEGGKYVYQVGASRLS